METLTPKILKVRVRLLDEMLGMSPGNPELATAHIERSLVGKKTPEEIKRTVEEETAFVEDGIGKASTVFPRDAEGRPFLWNYQLRGALKDWARGMVENGWTGTRRGKTEKGWNAYNIGRRVDSSIFVFPRQIPLTIPEGGKEGECERPLRAQTMKGERVALARSETVPVGTTFEFEIHILFDAYDTDVRQLLEYGQKYRGLGQWRNSGKGAFEFAIE